VRRRETPHSLKKEYNMRIKDALAGATSFVPPGVILMAATSIEDMQASLQKLGEDADAIRNKAVEEDRDLTDDETDQILALDEQQDVLGKRIQALTPKRAPGQGRRTTAEVGNSNAEGAGGTRRAIPATARDSARFGFSNLGEFALAVRKKKFGDFENESVKKLVAAATTYGNEGTGGDGGDLVPPEFSREIWQKVLAEENLMNRCTQLVTGGNSIVLPKDETTPWGTTGLQVYWDGEANTMTQRKAVFETSQFRLVKLTALAPATNEMLEDAISFESWIRAKVPGLMAQAINTGIVSGNGVGKPYGILQAVLSGSGISVAKETSQPSGTVWFANINKMWSRMYAPWRANAVWLINQDVEPQLEGMAFVGGGITPTAASSTPAYMPPGGLSDAPYGRLKGRPVIPVQACSTVGTQGDIMLVDLNQYMMLTKAGGVRTDISIHLYFDQDITAFRWVFRVNGQPVWSSAITPQNGTNSLSWAVALDNR
jgi:HK97 family phage major capsid protein